MRRPALLLLLLMVILTTSTSVVLAKPGQKMDLVCWVTPQGMEQSAYFMMTGSGIVQRFRLDGGQHDIYKPVDKFEMPGEGGWTLWQAKSHDPCANPTDVSHGDYLPPGTWYWHKYN